MIPFQENNRLPKKLILRKSKDIDILFQFGTKIFGRKLNMYFIKKEGDQQVAFFVKKKIGKAHVRNRSRRLIKEYYRLNKRKFQGYWIIFLVKEPVEFINQALEDIKRFFRHEKIVDWDC